MKETVLITGASGVLGRAIVDAAIQAGMAVRQGVRDPGRANPAAEAVRLDYVDPATIAPAFEGVSKLLLMAPTLDAGAPAKLGPVIDAAKRAGVKHVVFISALGANLNEQAPLRVVEHLVMDSGLPYTILRPNFFMENFSEGFLASSIKTQSAIFLAAGDGKTSFISTRDIASTVVSALRKGLTGSEFNLTGPEPLDHAEAAQLISEAVGRQVSYHPLSEEQMAAGALSAGMPAPAVAYLSVLYGAVRAGYCAAITNDVEQVTATPPMGFADFAKSAADSWRS